MTRLVLSVFCLTLFLINSCHSDASFTANTFIVPVSSSDGVYTLLEFNVGGTQLQSLKLPNGKVCAGCQLNVDSTGGIALLPMYTGNNSPFDNYGFGINVQVALSDTTTLTSQPSTSSVMVMDGQDTWFAVGGNIVYKTRGDTGSGVTIYSSSSNITYMQLVGTALYALIGTSLQVMDPIVKNGTRSFNTVLTGVTSFHISYSTLYVLLTDLTLKKYTDPVRTFQFAYGFKIDLQNVISMTSVQDSGTTYVLFVTRVNDISYIYRSTDTGSTFSTKQFLYANPGVIYSIGPSPKATCYDTWKNQDESDVDCGGSSCSKCIDGLTCSSNTDCVSGFCDSTNTCATPTCDDSVVNQNETDIDCGGTICNACPNMYSCKIDLDCTSLYCNGTLLCANPTCTDGAKNQNETDIDCGGSTVCDRCSLNQHCKNDSDCASNTCTNSVCVTPPVAVPIVEPVAVPVDTPVKSPESTAPVAIAVPVATPLASPVSTPIASPVNTPINAPSALPGTSRTPARNSLVSPAVGFEASVLIGTVINLILLII